MRSAISTKGATMAERKRYHQTKADRRRESRGMEEYEHRHRRHHHEDRGGMLHEDHDEPANLPQHVIHKKYPYGSTGLGYKIDDSLRGIDDAMHEDARRIHSHLDPEHY